ncbi:E3 ubiquitin-protein ligase synoviolin-like [Ciona intestinalis]
MRSLILTGSSFALTTAVVVNAFIQKKQFFPAVVYLTTKSSPCIAILYLQAFVLVLLFGKLMRKVFFGQLRPAETEHLIERSWYAVTDTCLAFTMFRDDFSPIFVASFTLLLFLKCFHWLLEDRVDYMERSPVITFIFKLRVLSLLAILLACDLIFVNMSYKSTMEKGASVQLVFGFEYAVLATVVFTVFLKYILHSIDLMSDNPWENKAVYMLHIELVTGFVRVVLYICFTIIMVKVHTFPLFSVRPMYLTMRQFKKALSDIVLSRRAIRNMNTLYPDATAEDLATTDSTCIICREEMHAANPEDQPPGSPPPVANKKLPCSHIFHASCLRSWFQRQQTCPTCRLDVLQTQQRAPTPPAPPNPPQVPPAGPGFVPPFLRPMFPPPQAMWGGAPPPPIPPQPTGAAPQAPPTQPSTSNQAPGAPLYMPPNPMFMPPMMPPPPPPPFNLTGMSDDQVRIMEGQERRAVEARIECLRNIKLLLDAAMMQMSQYTTVMQAQGDSFVIPPMPDLAEDTPPVNQETTEAEPTHEDTDAPSNGESVEEVVPAENNDDEVDFDSNPADATELRRRRLAKLESKTNENNEEDNNE